MYKVYISKLINFIKKNMNLDLVYAHCDVPCGIYDPFDAMMAARTVATMVTQINTILESDDYKGNENSIEIQNSITRRIIVKEEHAEKVKREVLILWSDYFKESDLKVVPDLHNLIWNTCKLASLVKQSVSIENANKLSESVSNVAEAFNKVKEARAKG
ncbi:MAG: superoxide dismutase, Ni [Patescibacteria group bacterium]|jgi:nickel superoxide dismutase